MIDSDVLNLIESDPRLAGCLKDMTTQNKVMQNEAIEIFSVIVNKNKELAEASPLKCS